MKNEVYIVKLSYLKIEYKNGNKWSLDKNESTTFSNKKAIEILKQLNKDYFSDIKEGFVKFKMISVEEIKTDRKEAEFTMNELGCEHIVYGYRKENEKYQKSFFAFDEETEFDDFIMKHQDCMIYAVHSRKTVKKLNFKRRKQQLEVVPITLKQANEFVSNFHRHHSKVTGCKFAIGLKENDEIIGVAICGRPVSRHLDNGLTLEINRLCVLEGYKNACSKLYGACVRIAKNMGYKKAITYILESENGASLKASNFIDEGRAGGVIWTGSRKRDNGVPKEYKRRYVYYINK